MEISPENEKTPSYYDVLGLDPGEQDPKEIRGAYRKKAKLLHPDTGGNPERMRQLNEAYLTIRDPSRREKYDRGRNKVTSREGSPVDTGPPQNIHDLWREAWRGIFEDFEELFRRDIQRELEETEAKRILNVSEFLGKEFLIPQEDEYLLWGMVIALKDNLGGLVIVDENDKPAWKLRRIQDPNSFYQSLAPEIKSTYQGPTHFTIERNIIDFRKAKTGDTSPVKARRYGIKPLTRDVNPNELFSVDKIYELERDKQVIVPQAFEPHLGDLERMATNIVGVGKEAKPFAPFYYKDNVDSLTRYVEINESRKGVLGEISRRKIGQIGVGLDLSRFRNINGEVITLETLPVVP